MNTFFKDNKHTFETFARELDINKDKLEGLKNYADIVALTRLMISSRNPNNFSICTFNIKHVGDNLISTITSNDIFQLWNDIIELFIRFTKEFEIKSKYTLSEIESFLKNYICTTEIPSGAYYALYVMPYDIINDSNLDGKDDFLMHLENTIDNKLPNKKQEIDNLKEDCNSYMKLLDGFKNEFSFLALNQAFNKLEDVKQVQLKRLSIFLGLLGFSIVLIPFIFYFLSYNVTLTVDQVAIRFIPLFFIISILIYYFKILLNKYNSISDQIVQLETKQAIMQFIESYVDYKKDKGLTNEELSKFEDIIFSQISPNLRDVPTSPDLVSLIDGISKATKRK